MKCFLFHRSFSLLLFLFLVLNSCNGQYNHYQTVTASQFSNQLKTEPGIVLDVRTPGEYNSGHLSSAENIDFYEADFKNQLLKLDSSKTIYVYCRVGRRSAKAADMLVKSGYKKVVNLNGGIEAWNENNLPVE